MKKVVGLSFVLIIIVVAVFVGYGILYPQDIKELNKHLDENKQLIKEHQDVYENIYVAKEKKEYDAKVEELNNRENDLGTAVKNLNISFVGDSVMLGAVRELGKMFPKSYSDALTSRSLIAGIGVVEDLKNSGKLGDYVVINLGANGDCYNGCKDKLMKIVGDDRQVFWLTVTDDYKVHINDKLKDLASKYDNLHVIDWEKLSEGHDEWFYNDGIHLPYKGQVAYTEVVYNALLDYYKEQFSKIREKELNEFVLSQLNGLEMFGNDLLVNVFDLIKDEYANVKVNIGKNVNDKTKNTVLLAYDSSLKNSEYESIINDLGDRTIYVISLNDDLTSYLNGLGKDNVKVLEFVKDEDSYLSDKKHLNSNANKELSELIKSNYKDTNK